MQNPFSRGPFRSGSRVALSAAAATIGIAVAAGGALAARNRNIRDREGREDDAPARTNKGAGSDDGHSANGKTILINESADALYDFCSDPANFADFMDNVASVRVDTDGTAHWRLEGSDKSLTTTMTDETRGKSLAWKSTDGSDIELTAEMIFRAAPGDRGTYVEYASSYGALEPALSEWLVSLFGSAPKVQARRDLKRLKMLIETGEIATSAHTNEKD
ncbi:MAG: SRPBCC family protein [Pontixanthobacter sp.]